MFGMDVYVMDAHVEVRTALESQFSSILIWVSVTELKLAGLFSKLSHLTKS